MRARSAISTIVATLALAGLSLASVRNFSPALNGGRAVISQSNQQPPSDAELRARTDKLIANQHGDDIAPAPVRIEASVLKGNSLLGGDAF